MVPDYRIKRKLKAKKGVGTIFGNKGDKRTLILDGKRRCYIRITTFIGTSVSWAKHYYARFHINSLNVKDKDGKKFGMLGYGYSKAGSIEDIDITYILKKDLIERDGYKLKKGERTTRFTDLNLLKKRIKEEAKRIFGEDWEVDLSELEDY